MKKFLVIILICLCTGTAFADDYFNLGKVAYDHGRYGQAKEYLSIAVKNKPKNITYRYYYALSLTQLGLIEEASEQYQTITLSSPNSREGQKSARALESLKKYFETQAGDFKLPDDSNKHYMPYIIMENTDIKRWDKANLNVYIQETQSKSIVEKAFQTWEDKSDGIVKFSFIPTKELADITVTFIDKMPVIKNEYGDIKGSANVKYSEKNITHADIIIQDKDSKTKEDFSPDRIYVTALHEIGHAIGINTHSDDVRDIMSWYLTDENPTISKSDINTLKILYGISEQSLKEIHDNPTIYSIKLNKAKEYATAYPQLPTAWSGLASAYVAMGNYEKAVESINKAIELKGDDATLYTQLAWYYTKLNKPSLAIENYKKAYDMEPDNKVYLYNWAKACYKNKQPEVARADVDSYLMGQGFLSNDEISRLLRRMYKQDKEKEKAKIKKDREDKKRKIEEMQELEQEMFVD